MNSILDSIHTAIAKSELLVNLSIKIRNQMHAVVGKSLSDGIYQASNGEDLVLQTIRPLCQSFVDVGANVGQWTASFVAANPKPVRGLLIEPNPAACKLLRKRFIDSPYQVIEAAAGQDCGTAKFFIEGSIGETSSLVVSATEHISSSIEVNVRPLDELMETLGIDSVDILKIDAEGYDFQVMLGARKLIERQRVKFIQFEYNAPWARAGATLGRAELFLSDAGYRLFLIKKSGLHEFSYAKYGEYFRYSNFIAVHRDFVDAVADIVGPSF